MSIDLKNEINRILRNKTAERHSFFQLQYFLIGKEPTIQSKLWRCVHELKSRKDTLDLLKLEIEDINDTIKLIDIKINELIACDNKSEIEKNQIKIRKLNRKKTEYFKKIESLNDRERGISEEIQFIVAAFNSLEKQEPIKDYDDIECQKNYWNEKLLQDYNLRELFGLPQDMESLKTILALNSDSTAKQNILNRIEIIRALKMKKKLDSSEYEMLIESAKNQDNQEKQIKDLEHGV